MFRLFLAAVIVAAAGYLAFWPVEVAPVAWKPVPDPGYVGRYKVNSDLALLRRVELPEGMHGPEDAAIGADGALYVTEGGGRILLRGASGDWSIYAETGGRPLGIEAGPDGALYIADAYRGLMRVDAAGVELLAGEDAEGAPIVYANSLDFAPDGAIWFTEASTKFGAEANGGTLAASKLEILEHARTGRILRYDPKTGKAKTMAAGFGFPNGLSMGPNGKWLIFAETADYALHKLWISGPRTGEVETLMDDLPGFPDNVKRDAAGGFLVGLVSRRSGIVDALAEYPALRAVVQRLPEFLKPDAVSYGFILSLDEKGALRRTWQDPTGAFPLTTGAVRGRDGALWITSLGATAVGRLAEP